MLETDVATALARANQGAGSSSSGIIPSTTIVVGAGTKAPNSSGIVQLTTTDDTLENVYTILFPTLINANGQVATADIRIEVVATNTGATGGNRGDTYRFSQVFTMVKNGTGNPTLHFTGTPAQAGGDAGENTIAANVVALLGGLAAVIQVQGVIGHTLAITVDYSVQQRNP